MAVQLPALWLDPILKGAYKTYAANARFLTANSAGRIAFLGTCVVELYGLDRGAAYPLAFVYIRQLAMLLRAALTMKTKVGQPTNLWHP